MGKDKGQSEERTRDSQREELRTVGKRASRKRSSAWQAVNWDWKEPKPVSRNLVSKGDRGHGKKQKHGRLDADVFRLWGKPWKMPVKIRGRLRR